MYLTEMSLEDSDCGYDMSYRTHRLHFFRILLGPPEPSYVIPNPQTLLVKVSQQRVSEVHPPLPRTHLLQSYLPGLQRDTDKDPLPKAPAHRPVAAHVCIYHPLGILPRADLRRKSTARMLVELTRLTLAQGLVRPPLVVVLAECIEPALLPPQAVGRWSGGFRLQLSVHPLVAPVLLRVPRVRVLSVRGSDPDRQLN